MHPMCKLIKAFLKLIDLVFIKRTLTLNNPDNKPLISIIGVGEFAIIM